MRGNPGVCVSWCSDRTSGDMGIIAHGLSHKFECIYLCSLVVMLGCVRLRRGAHCLRLVSTRSVFACPVGDIGVCVCVCVSATVQEGSRVRCALPHAVDCSACVPVSAVGLHVCMTFAL